MLDRVVALIHIMNMFNVLEAIFVVNFIKTV